MNTEIETWRDDLLETIMNESRAVIKAELPIFITNLKEILTSLDQQGAQQAAQELIQDDLADDIEIRIRISEIGDPDGIDKVYLLSEIAKLRQEHMVERKIRTALRNWRYVRILLQDAIQALMPALNNMTEGGRQTEVGNSTIQLRVENAFGFMQKNDPRMHKLILNETDFYRLIEWITHYYENGFSIPEITKPIQTVNTAKGNIVFAFKDFYKQEHPTKSYPDTLFKLIRACFYQYREDDIKNLKKSKKPQYFDDLLNNA